MHVTKLAHSCLYIQEGSTSILVDPGSWNTLPVIPTLDALLITHEHQDHFDIEQVKALVAQFPGAKVITHEAVGAKLRDAGIAYEVLETGTSTEVAGVRIESYGTEHASIYGGVSPCRNQGYLVAGRLYLPGDALHDVPSVPVEILALPTGGPWMKLSEAIDYAKAVKPRIAFPIHDAMYTDEYRATSIPRWVGTNLEESGITFRLLVAGETAEF